jgi:hypothetical protein
VVWRGEVSEEVGEQTGGLMVGAGGRTEIVGRIGLVAVGKSAEH